MKIIYKLAIILCVIIISFCSSKKSETIIIVKDGNATVTAVNFHFNFNDPNPNYFIPGAMIIFKTDGEVLNQQGYAGKVYKIDKDLVLKEIVTIDTSLTNNELIEKFLIKK